MAIFTVCTHVGDEKPVHVNLDTVQMIEPYHDGALIKFAGGAALIVQEAPGQLTMIPVPAHTAGQSQAPGQALQAADQTVQSPAQSDKRQGPLRVNLATGKWVDIETGQGGSDVVSLAGYLQSLSEFDAARRLASITGLSLANAPTPHRAPTETERVESGGVDRLSGCDAARRVVPLTGLSMNPVTNDRIVHRPPMERAQSARSESLLAVPVKRLVQACAGSENRLPGPPKSLLPSQTDQVPQSTFASDKHQGPLKINLATGKWVDLEAGQGGSDVVSLALYFQSLSEFDATRLVASITGLSMGTVMNETIPHRAPTETERVESGGPESLLAVPVRKLGQMGEGSDKRARPTWLVPAQTVEAAEQVPQSPTPGDKRQGPLKINVATGKWIDLETGQRGSDVASLALYLQSLSELDAARRLASITGLSTNDVANDTIPHRVPTERPDRAENSIVPESLLAVPVRKLSPANEGRQESLAGRPKSLAPSPQV